ncbi:PH domain-containing protein [Aeromicrobium sp. CF3.5]|uniref:PH domain-containing protein n=1 Tax=Aeromicrobium sp. CF3.5 TaxID=3373078 RepID=UPI003EE61750
MGLPRKLMIEGETTVSETRTHVKVLFLPFLILVVVSGATAYLATQVGDVGGGVARWIVVGVGLVLIIVGAVLPWLRWITWTYTLTNRRIVEQRGILTRTGRIIPLSRINDVAYEKHLNDRLLGCGTLVIHDASEQEGLRLNDIPGIEDFHRTVSTLVFGEHEGDRRDESV